MVLVPIISFNRLVINDILTAGGHFNLVVTMLPSCDKHEVTSFLLDYLRDALLTSVNGFQLLYKLDKKDERVFPELLHKLETYRDYLRIGGYSISTASLDDVFTRFKS